MKLLKSALSLNKFEWGLWGLSVLTITVSFLCCPKPDFLTLIASLIGVTALIYVAKGYVLGQLLTVVFALFYGAVSFFFRYYGEMITYLLMTAPIAVAAIVSWVKHPYKDTEEVRVSRLSRKQIIWLALSDIAVTVAFYFILGALGNANLLVSTLSVTTSFAAASLTFLRSPYYAIAYALNDLVLIVLWIMATIVSVSFLPMVFCFVMFFANDIYGFVNWRRMQKRQTCT